MNEPIPIACALTDKELQARRRDVLSKAARVLLDKSETPGGFLYVFPLSGDVLLDLAEIIDLERRCCPFLDFKLTVEAGANVVSLELSGPDGAQEFIKNLGFFEVSKS